jgi:hypothetical protein
MFQRIGQLFGKKSASGAPGGFPRLGNQGTMLAVYLSAMPVATQAQQKARFASVPANFECSLFVANQAAERLAGEAMQKGLTVWVNMDATSTFLYGAGRVGADQFSEVMTWLRNAAEPGQKIQVGIHNPGEPIKLIEIAV